MKKPSVKEVTKPLLERVNAVIQGMDWSVPEVYGNFLAQTHYHICHSTRLLAAAGGRFSVAQENLHLHCMKHAAEERSHEKLSTSDLERVGFRLADFPELSSTKNLYRNIYYLIDRVNPVAIYGYAYFLECIAVSPGASFIEEKACEKFGVNAVKHVALHLKEDPEHIEAYEKQLEHFNSEERACLIDAIETTGYNYERIYLEIIQKNQAAWKKRAA